MSEELVPNDDEIECEIDRMRKPGPVSPVGDDAIILKREVMRRIFDEAWCFGVGGGLQELTQQETVASVIKPLADRADDPFIRMLSVPPPELQSFALQNRRWHDQAQFAQQQIADFCVRRYYEINPLTVGNAMAGVPVMGWRQSMRRCMKLQKAGRMQDSNDNSYFGTFKLIRSLVSHIDSRFATDTSMEKKSPEVLRWIRNMHSQLKGSLLDLRQHRKELMAAVHIGYEDVFSIKERPYAITREYLKAVRVLNHPQY